MSDAYLSEMLIRIVTMLAILAITLVTTMASAHAARMGMSSGPDHAMHVGAIMVHGADRTMPGCDGAQTCGVSDAGLCEFVCHGVSVVLNMPSTQAAIAYGFAAFNLPAAETLAGRAPDLSERPPKFRLL